MRSVHGLVATGGPAGPLLHPDRMVRTSDQNPPAPHLLEVAFEAQIVVPHREHLLIDRAVRLVAGGASIAHGFVLEHEGASHGRMARQAVLILGQQGGAALYRRTFVRIVTIPALHPMLRHLVMVGQRELAARLQVALETILRRRPGVQNGVPLRGKKDPRSPGLVINRWRWIAAALGMQTARAVAGFAPRIQRIGTFCQKPRVAGGLEVSNDLFVTFCACL